MSKPLISSSLFCRPSASSALVVVLFCFMYLVYNITFITRDSHSKSNAIIYSNDNSNIEQPSSLEDQKASYDKTRQFHDKKDHVQKANKNSIVANTNFQLDSNDAADINGTFSRRCPKGNYGCKNDKSKHLSKALIIGVPKCGTTALEWFLLLHDQIQSGVGEPHYFDWHYKRGVQWYCKKMPCTYDNVMVIERTPRYYVHLSQHNVYDFDPNMKLLLVVRDPVERMVSHLVHNFGYHEWEFYKNKVMDSRNTVKENNKWIKMSQYFKYLDSWTQLFNYEEKLLILDYNDLIENPYDVVYRVETFLNLEHKVQPDMMYFDNNKGFYCKYTDKELNATTCMGSAKGRPHPTVPKAEVKKFKHFFKPWNEKFFDAIGQDFGWNKDVP